jgi:hypothetical protein
MAECFCVAAQLVVDAKFPTKKRLVVEGLQMREILSRVLLRLLGNQEGKL